MHSAVSNQIVCMEFEDTIVNIISELERYYSLLLLRISAQEKIELATIRIIFIKYPLEFEFLFNFDVSLVAWSLFIYRR